MKKWCLIAGMAIFPILIATGCGKLGQVDQGRVIQFDKAKGTVTIIRDVKADPQNPDYSHLPPMTYDLPADPNEMGPEPKAGLRMKLDTQTKEIVIYDLAAQNFKTIQYTLIDQKENIASDNPLVLEGQKPKKYPVIDQGKKTITIYSKRQKVLTTFSVPEEYFALPDYTWDNGDEIRVYYKEEGKSLRFMNITKTDIFKK